MYPPRKTAIVQTIFTIELDHQSLLEIVGCLPHNLGITVLEDVITPDLDLAVPWLRAHRRLTAEVDEFPPEVALVLRNVRIKGRGQTGVVPGGCLRVVIDEVDAGS